MSRSLVCLALLALVAAAAAAPLPAYKCTGKITNPDPSGPKTLPYTEWIANLVGADGKQKLGTLKICWNRQGVNATTVKDTAEFQWAATLTNVPGYISVSVGLKNQTILNLGEFGEVGYPPLSVAKKLDVFGILPKTAFPNPSLQAFVNAMCVTTDTKNVFAAAAINAYVNATTAGQLPAVQFKLNKGACFPALP